jgi:hypothetical protein
MSKPKQEQVEKDDPASAPESGDQQATGRSRGQIIEHGSNGGDAADQSEQHTGEEFESGRHDAAPRSGD